MPKPRALALYSTGVILGASITYGLLESYIILAIFSSVIAVLCGAWAADLDWKLSFGSEK